MSSFYQKVSGKTKKEIAADFERTLNDRWLGCGEPTNTQSQ